MPTWTTSGFIRNSGTWTGNLDSNTGVVTLANGSSWTGDLTNDDVGTINLGTSLVSATNQLVTGDVINAGQHAVKRRGRATWQRRTAVSLPTQK